MNPFWIFIMQNGQIWISIQPSFTPSGTVAAKYELCTLPATQQLGTISGNAGAYAATANSGHGYGHEIS